MPHSSSNLRWFLKKTARQSVSRGTDMLRRFLPADPAIRVLTYHRFGDLPNDPFCLPAAAFEAQVNYLAANDLAIGLDELLAYLAGPKELSEDRVLLTIDDGFQSTSAIALPILEQYRVPSVAFVSPGLIGSTAPQMPEPYMTWDELQNTAGSLMKIGSHSMAHESYGRLSHDAVRNDAAQSKQRLEEHLGYEVHSFAYPYGTRSDFNPQVAAILESCGYQAAFTSIHGPLDSSVERHQVPRVKVESGEDLEFFIRLVHGAMDSWSFIDNHLAVLQANR